MDRGTMRRTKLNDPNMERVTEMVRNDCQLTGRYQS